MPNTLGMFNYTVSGMAREILYLPGTDAASVGLRPQHMTGCAQIGPHGRPVGARRNISVLACDSSHITWAGVFSVGHVNILFFGTS